MSIVVPPARYRKCRALVAGNAVTANAPGKLVLKVWRQLVGTGIERGARLRTAQDHVVHRVQHEQIVENFGWEALPRLTFADDKAVEIGWQASDGQTRTSFCAIRGKCCSIVDSGRPSLRRRDGIFAGFSHPSCSVCIAREALSRSCNICANSSSERISGSSLLT